MGIANELITRGWHQGALRGPNGSVCLVGATDYAFLDNAALFGRALDHILTLCGGEPVSEWNDHPERTFDEVLRVAKEADEILEAS